jgi:hypothetical protein
MEIAGPVIVLIAFGILIALFIQAGFLLWGASIAKIKNRSFGKALLTIILSGIASFVLPLILIAIPVAGTISGLIVGFFVSALIMMPIFKTTFGKALAAAMIAWVLGIVVLGGLTLLIIVLAGGMVAFA